MFEILFDKSSSLSGTYNKRKKTRLPNIGIYFSKETGSLRRDTNCSK